MLFHQKNTSIKHKKAVTVKNGRLYEWIPQLNKPEEESIEPIDVSTFRVPGSPVGAGKGEITTIDGVDPNARNVTGMSGKDKSDEDKRLVFCVATVKKSEVAL